MRENRTSGSARGAPGNRRPYRGGRQCLVLSGGQNITAHWARRLATGRLLPVLDQLRGWKRQPVSRKKASKNNSNVA